MRLLGEFCLLGAFVGTAYSALAILLGWASRHEGLRKTGIVAACSSFGALTLTMAILIYGLLVKDFRFAYVQQYSSHQLPWHYSLSSLWVGQAGSLLLWTWFCESLALLFYFSRYRDAGALRTPTLGVLMAFCCFLTTVMVFAADPLVGSLSPTADGVGLSPVLRHPAMLIHPPIVFLGYSLWSIPFALAVTALATGQVDELVRAARPWALLGWLVLGAGILVGAQWAYGELGWGGYWSWDPVENGSLLPWLVGTSAIHALMAWRRCGMLKKSACALCMTAFGMCNFATFLTRSGIFSSLHAFSQSPIGWLFLVLMLGIVLGGAILIYVRRPLLAPRRSLPTVWCREAMVMISTLSLMTLASLICVGTLSTAISDLVLGQKIAVGPDFYNHVLIPTSLVALLTTAIAPLLRWGAAPRADQRRALCAAAALAVCAVAVAYVAGLRHTLGLTLCGLAGLALAALGGSLWLDTSKSPQGHWRGLQRTIVGRRRQYAGFVIHGGLFCLAIGVAGSSLGSQRHQAVMSPGDAISVLGREVRFARLTQDEQTDKLVVASQLEVVNESGHRFELSPAQHYHYAQREWTTEVAIGSSWSSDFYTILDANEGDERVRLTFIETPLISLLWTGGWVMGAGALLAIWPSRRVFARALPERNAVVNRSGQLRTGIARAASILLIVSTITSQGIPVARGHGWGGLAGRCAMKASGVTNVWHGVRR